MSGVAVEERERERAAEAAAVSRTRIERTRTVDRDVGGRFAVEAEGSGGGGGETDRRRGCEAAEAAAYIAVRKEGRGHAMGKDSEYSSICDQKCCLGGCEEYPPKAL